MNKPEDSSKLKREPVAPLANVARPPPGTSGPVAIQLDEVALRTVTVRPTAPSVTTEGESNIASAQFPIMNRNDPYLGKVIDDRYRVEAIIGEGGMGIVYLCKHKVIGKRVAMKVLRADLARDQEVTTRFLNEAKSASAIGNPHIIDISDFGQLPDGSTYFVMEHLDGDPLTRLIDSKQPVPINRILHIARQLGEALAAAHDAGIVHRDLKPDNIFLITRGNEKDFVKILDFGIAKVSSAEGRLTRVGTVFGTPHYMSPEQAAGTTVDHRGDIYSMGVILYELASGRVPFDADNFMGILTQHMYKAPVPIRALVPLIQDIPPGLEAIILKCLSKRPEHRYQSMGELVDELQKVQNGLVPDAVPELMDRSGGFNVPSDYFRQAPAAGAVSPTSRKLGHNRWPLYAGMAGIVAAIGIVVAIFAQSSSGRATQVQRGVLAPDSAPVAPPAGPASSLSEQRDEVKSIRQVVIAVEPMDAHVFIGEKDLGTSPVVVEVSESTTLQIDVKKSGYVSKALNLNGSEGRLTVVLDKRTARGTANKPAADPRSGKRTKGSRAGSGMNGGEISDPWAR